MSLRYMFQMPDGSTVEVDDKTYIALHYIQDMMTLVSTGKLANFSVVQIDTEGRDSSFMLLGEHLETLYSELLKQAGVAIDLAKSWKGTAPPENRSQRHH